MPRRPSPALVISCLALLFAASGTALAAGELITRSDQLADQVVTGPKLATGAVDSRTVATDSLTRNDLADRSVSNRELTNPIFTAAVESDGTVSSGQSVGVDQSKTRKIDQVGGGVIYDVGFQQDVSQCVYSATPGRTRRGGNLSPVFLNPQSRASNPRIVTVFVRDKEGSFFTLIRPSFHLIVVC